MAESPMDFDSFEESQELKERISDHFATFKEELNTQQDDNVKRMLDDANSASDDLLLKVNYEIDRFTNDKRTRGHYMTRAGNSELINKKKAEILLKFQTLTAKIGCHIMDDYMKTMEAKKSCSQN